MTLLQKVGRVWLGRGVALEPPTIKAHVARPQLRETRELFRQCLWYGVSGGATGNYRDDQKALSKRRAL
jgi:hypothetical protein